VRQAAIEPGAYAVAEESYWDRKLVRSSFRALSAHTPTSGPMANRLCISRGRQTTTALGLVDWSDRFRRNPVVAVRSSEGSFMTRLQTLVIARRITAGSPLHYSDHVIGQSPGFLRQSLRDACRGHRLEMRRCAPCARNDQPHQQPSSERINSLEEVLDEAAMNLSIDAPISLSKL
jgi:hypothetical protein